MSAVHGKLVTADEEMRVEDAMPARPPVTVTHEARIRPRPRPMRCSCGLACDVCGYCGRIMHADSLRATASSTECRDREACRERMRASADLGEVRAIRG